MNLPQFTSFSCQWDFKILAVSPQANSLTLFCLLLVSAQWDSFTKPICKFTDSPWAIIPALTLASEHRILPAPQPLQTAKVVSSSQGQVTKLFCTVVYLAPFAISLWSNDQGGMQFSTTKFCLFLDLASPSASTSRCQTRGQLFASQSVLELRRDCR